MKFTTLFAVIATVATAVSAMLSDASLNTNAKRLAYGLGPFPPVRRSPTPSYAARRGQPSGINNSCNSGPVQCCNSVTSANPTVRKTVEDLVGLVVAPDVAVGFTCAPLKALGLGAQSCTSQTVCCENNSFNGIVAVGCSPININLI